MKLRVGYIDYLNSYPFYHALLGNSSLPYNFIGGNPAFLNKKFYAGELDVSQISAGAYPSVSEMCDVLPDFCIAADGFVKSVILLSSFELRDLSGKRIGVTGESRSSVILLQIIMRKYYNIEPQYIEISDSDYSSYDAFLLIGNEALKIKRELFPFCFDLGELWKEKTGHAMVFAVFVVNRNISHNHKNEIELLLQNYRESLDYFYQNKAVIIAEAAKRYPLIQTDLDQYYSYLKYNFTPELQDSFAYYLHEGAMLGLLDPVKKISCFG